MRKLDSKSLFSEIRSSLAHQRHFFPLVSFDSSEMSKEYPSYYKTREKLRILLKTKDRSKSSYRRSIN